MPSFTHTIDVAASSIRLWSLVSDVQRVALLFPYARVEEVCRPNPQSWLFWRQLAIPYVAELRWREEARVIAEGEMSFQAVEGDLTTFAGHWLVAPNGADATLTLALEYEIPQGFVPNMPTVAVSYVMREIFISICQRLKDAAEEGV